MIGSPEAEVMEFNDEMLISLSVAFCQFVSAILITYMIARQHSRGTILTILWLTYDLITHVTLVCSISNIKLKSSLKPSLF